MSEGLCWKCKEERSRGGWVILPGDHCHHEPKEKPPCICVNQGPSVYEFRRADRVATLWTGIWQLVSFCPGCGRKL